MPNEPIDLDESEINTPQQPGEQPEQVLQTECAFVVFLDPTGHWIATDGLLNQPVVPARAATADDYSHAASDISRDVTASSTANAMVQMMQQAGQAAMQQQQNQQILSQIKGGGGSNSKLHLPG